MRTKKLPPRLAAMARYVAAGESIADIGADHGYLPTHLVREGISPFAILTDVKKGPLEKTRASVERGGGQCITAPDAGGRGLVMTAGENTRIELRLGDGLSPIDKAEVDVVAIAGLGGETIVSILAADPDKTGSFRRFILQPRTKTGILRSWLAGAGFEITADKKVEEKGRLCDIIVCIPQRTNGTVQDFSLQASGEQYDRQSRIY